jgi:hypothetical protein
MNKPRKPTDRTLRNNSFSDKKKQDRFLNHYSVYGNLQKAAKHCGSPASTIYAYMQRHPDFKAAVDEAYEQFKGSIELEIHARAVLGEDEPVYYKGEIVGHVKRKSDKLLEFIAKRHIAEYRDQSSIDMNMKGGVLAVSTKPRTPEEAAAFLEKVQNMTQDEVL